MKKLVHWLPKPALPRFEPFAPDLALHRETDDNASVISVFIHAIEDEVRDKRAARRVAGTGEELVFPG